MGYDERDETRGARSGGGGPSGERGRPEQETGLRERQPRRDEPDEHRARFPGVEDLLDEETNTTLDAPFRDEDEE